jgi:hypothetical protein
MLPGYFSLGKMTTIVGERPNTWRKRDEARRFSRMRGVGAPWEGERPGAISRLGPSKRLGPIKKTMSIDRLCGGEFPDAV